MKYNPKKYLILDNKLRDKTAKLTARKQKLETIHTDLLACESEKINIRKLMRLERKIININNNIAFNQAKIEAVAAGKYPVKGLKKQTGGFLSVSARNVVVTYLNQKKEIQGNLLEAATKRYITLAKAKQEGQKRISLRRVVDAGRGMERLNSKVQHYDLELLRLEEGKYPVLNFFGKIKKSFSQMPYRKQKIIFGLLFLTPWIVGFCIFFAVPVFTTIVWSFQQLKTIPGGGFESAFIGFKNYRDLFTTATLAGATISEVIAASVIDILIDLPTILIFSLFIAVLLNTKFKGHEIVKAIFFVPVVYNITVINNTLTGMFGQRFDIAIEEGFALSYRFAVFLQQIGIGGDLIDFLISAVDRIFTIVNMSGIQILMFIAALQSIPKHLYEAARVEGATAYEMFWKITFPMVSPIIMTAIVFTIVNSFATSDIMNFMTVNSQGTTMATNNPGLYSAISIIYFLANALIIAVAFFLMRKVVFYHDK